jgi:hypothetical protein
MALQPRNGNAPRNANTAQFAEGYHRPAWSRNENDNNAAAHRCPKVVHRAVAVARKRLVASPRQLDDLISFSATYRNRTDS